MTFKRITAYHVTRSTPLEDLLNHLEIMKAEAAGTDLHIIRGSATFLSRSNETVDNLRYRLMSDPADLMRPVVSDAGHKVKAGDIVEAKVNDPASQVYAGSKGVVCFVSETGRTIVVNFGTVQNSYHAEERDQLRHFARS